jgi:membrane-associated phospholipid phosphatase
MLERNRELLACFAVSLLPTLVLFAFFPAGSAWVYYKIEPGKIPTFLVALEALRNGTLPVIYVQRLDGLVTFPSFHTAATIMLVYVARGIRYLFLSAVLNGLMLVSTVSEGVHYFVDVIGGVVVALCSILIVRVAMRRVQRARTSPAEP